MATARRRNYASQAAPLQPRAPRPAPRPAGSRLLIAAPAWGHGAAPADRTRSLRALRLLGRTFRFGMGTSKGKNLGQKGTVGAASLKPPGPLLSVSAGGCSMAWRAAKRSPQRLAPELLVRVVAWDGAGQPGLSVGTGCTVPCSPADPQRRSPRAVTERARSPVAPGYGTGVFHVRLCFPFSLLPWTCE